VQRGTGHWEVGTAPWVGVLSASSRNGRERSCFSAEVIRFALLFRLMLTRMLGGYNSPNAARAWTYLTSIAVSGSY
jgi:hypothetical protein